MSPDYHFQLEDTTLRLSDYLKTIEVVIKETFAHHVWIKAEIRNLSQKNGHYYFELAEKDEQGKIVASCRANLWRYQAQRTLKKFSQHTGIQLTRDLTVLLKVTANMHPQYGFSLTITDIDPNYTVGDLARQYRVMLDRLSGDGLTTLNKSLAMPFDLRHVIVIAPEQAAGLGDFRAEADHLQSHQACQFHYHHATFQGNHAPKEIRHAITSSVQSFQHQYHQIPDLMVIIRGGGAVGDLAYLNDYELAELVAEQPMPVWVGVGHERDRVILDEVAHTSFDTPSKVIHAIINHLQTMVQQTQQHINTIQSISRQQLQLAKANTQRCLSQIQAKSTSQLINKQKDSEYSIAMIQRIAQRQLKQANQQTQQAIKDIYQSSQQAIYFANAQTNHHTNSIQQIVKTSVKQANEHTQHLYQQTKQSAYTQVYQASQNSNHLRQVILLQHPKRVLKQGYAMIRNPQGDILTQSQQLQNHQQVDIEMADGTTTALIASH